MSLIFSRSIYTHISIFPHSSTLRRNTIFPRPLSIPYTHKQKSHLMINFVLGRIEFQFLLLGKPTGIVGCGGCRLLRWRRSPASSRRLVSSRIAASGNDSRAARIVGRSLRGCSCSCSAHRQRKRNTRSGRYAYMYVRRRRDGADDAKIIPSYFTCTLYTTYSSPNKAVTNPCWIPLRSIQNGFHLVWKQFPKWKLFPFCLDTISN